MKRQFNSIAKAWIALLIAVVILASTGVARAENLSVLPWTSPHFQDHSLVNRLYDGDGQPNSWTDVVERLRDASHILIGEIHNNADHHKIQAAIVERVARFERKPRIAFEMVPFSLQNVLDKAKPESVAELGTQLRWNERGWPDWSMYSLVFEAALANGMPLLAANLSRAETMALARQPDSEAARSLIKQFNLETALPKDAEQSLLKELARSHCGLMPEQVLAPMQLVQRARDGAMAQATGYDAEQTTVLIAGRGHVRQDRGVPFVLRQRVSDLKIISIGLFEVTPEQADIGDYELLNEQGEPLYDFVMFTPKASIDDPCIALREKFGKGSGTETDKAKPKP
ncbi:MAG: ChaN family lipoprotein [Pseudomonadota bacterium]